MVYHSVIHPENVVPIGISPARLAPVEMPRISSIDDTVRMIKRMAGGPKIVDGTRFYSVLHVDILHPPEEAPRNRIRARDYPTLYAELNSHTPIEPGIPIEVMYNAIFKEGPNPYLMVGRSAYLGGSSHQRFKFAYFLDGGGKFGELDGNLDAVGHYEGGHKGTADMKLSRGHYPTQGIKFVPVSVPAILDRNRLNARSEYGALLEYFWNLHDDTTPDGTKRKREPVEKRKPEPVALAA